MKIESNTSARVLKQLYSIVIRECSDDAMLLINILQLYRSQLVISASDMK